MFFDRAIGHSISRGLKLAREDLAASLADRIQPDRSRRTQMARLICRSFLMNWRLLEGWYRGHVGQKDQDEE